MAVITTVTSTMSILKSFIEILKDVKNWGAAKKEKNRTIIKTLGNASSETAIAIKQLRDGDKAAIEKLEVSIGRLWYEAAALLHDEDKEMSMMLFAKAAAWRDAETWSEADYVIAKENLRLIDSYVKEVIEQA
jgi:hypothetical protein